MSDVDKMTHDIFDEFLRKADEAQKEIQERVAALDVVLDELLHGE